MARICTSPGGPGGGLGPQLQGTVNWLPVGDSITVGVNGGGVPHNTLIGGYRHILSNWYWFDPEKFAAINAVGSVSSGAQDTFVNIGSFAFSGQKIEDFDSGGAHDIGPSITTPDVAARPAIASVMLGTNNMTSLAAANAAGPLMASLLSYMYGLRADLRVLLCTIPPNASASVNVWIETYNALLTGPGGVLEAAQAGGQQILLVDVYPLMNPATDIGTDGVHPNDLGYEIIGTAIRPVMRQLCGYSATPD